MGISEQIAGSTSAPDLCAEANEMWLFHGCSHAAAEGITTNEFDLARANPMGLFGGGIYFSESVSKSDEYTVPTMVDGKEQFALLLCRVILGNVYYCTERKPDNRDLENKCLKEGWHSVLGDRPWW